MNNLENIVKYSAGSLTDEIQNALIDWDAHDNSLRLWNNDPTLWTDHDENKWTGWLDIAESEFCDIARIEALANEIKNTGFKDVVVLGMGGSSLFPDMMARTFGKIKDFPVLHILDSTDPWQILHLEKSIDLDHTFFIVSSKSGGTLEPNIFKQYFYHKLQVALNKSEVGDCFLAITDHGTKLEALEKRDHFKDVFYGKSSIGGRYSALSNFGMVPSGLMGIDIARFLHIAEDMAQACGAKHSAHENPGVMLGILLGVCGRHNKDKVTLIVSPGIEALGAWLEQLLAESTGKEGKGLVPIDLEPLGKPEVYGNDRLFVYIRLENGADVEQDRVINILEEAGHVVVRCGLKEIMHLGAELFKWEMAIAVAGSILELNPFNQPDVESSKVRTIEITNEYSKSGKLPEQMPFYSDDDIDLFADDKNETEIKKLLKGSPTLENYLHAHLDRIEKHDYVDLSAFIERTDHNTELLQKSRVLIRDSKKVATCLGFGPRFLHSTGQLYKGGPNSGVFFQITTEHHEDIPVPGEKYTFGVVITAQALADFEVLAQRSRRALRIHFKRDLESGLKKFHQLIEKAL